MLEYSGMPMLSIPGFYLANLYWILGNIQRHIIEAFETGYLEFV